MDKTEYIHKLLCGSKENILSRPRRFGKSLLVSTLKAIFQGRRELFDGLAIDQLPYDWKTYPVIHLDLGNFGGSTPAKLESFLENLLAREAKEHDATLRGTGAAMRFENLLYDLAAVHGQAVVLVDEYDKPILANVTSPEAKGLLRILKGFYGVIKTYEGKIRFALLTGVSKRRTDPRPQVLREIPLLRPAHRLRRRELRLLQGTADRLGRDHAGLAAWRQAGKGRKDELFRGLLPTMDIYP